MSDSYDFLFKFLVIGTAGCGKSCLTHQFINNEFKEDSSHTIGVDFGSKTVSIGGKCVKLQIWDTAGQERFRSVARRYYRGAAGALLVYDITNRESFNELATWLVDAKTLASQNIVIFLVGNKKDLEEERQVTFLEASRFAQENGLMFLETSAKTGESVEEAFLKCSKSILVKIETGELDPDRLGSGIQYGDVNSPYLRLEHNGQRFSNYPGCLCLGRHKDSQKNVLDPAAPLHPRPSRQNRQRKARRQRNRKGAKMIFLIMKVLFRLYLFLYVAIIFVSRSLVDTVVFLLQ